MVSVTFRFCYGSVSKNTAIAKVHVHVFTIYIFTFWTKKGNCQDVKIRNRAKTIFSKNSHFRFRNTSLKIRDALRVGLEASGTGHAQKQGGTVITLRIKGFMVIYVISENIATNCYINPVMFQRVFCHFLCGNQIIALNAKI